MRITQYFTTWSSDDMLDIVFENRNKVYGAYELRRHYPDRLKKSLVICALISLTVFGASSYLFHNFHKNDIKPPIVIDSGLYLEHNNYTVKVDKPAAAEKSTVKKVVTEFTPKMIVSDTMEKLNQKEDTVSVAFSEQGISGGDGLPASSDLNGSSSGSANGFGDSLPGVTDETYMVAPSVLPTYPGGQQALTRYLQRHLKCPHLNSNVKGKMYLSFIVTRDGEVKDAEVIRDNVGYGCAEEAISVLEKMPKWFPGSYNDHAVNVKMIIPISIQNEK